ncbi:MAG: hypothetical protein GY774_09515 [Planctomycetes bacterium]|nr:hypothetical protein [Planctomycetota bacterium]
MGIDLFVSHLNAQLPNYITWKKYHHKMDAFHYPWQDGDYAFPPFAVISRVLRKVRRNKCQIVLVAPCWATQTWFPTLKEMLWAKPMQLGYSQKLLQDPAGNPHPLGKILHLMAWPICGVDSSQRAGQKKLLEQ